MSILEENNNKNMETSITEENPISPPKIKKRNIKLNILILVVSIIVSLILGEILMRVYYSHQGLTLAIDEEEKCTKDLYNIIRNQSSINRFSPQQLMFHEYWNYSGVRPTANFDGNIILYTNDGSRVLF